jgi:hypothetical protein
VMHHRATGSRRAEAALAEQLGLRPTTIRDR